MRHKNWIQSTLVISNSKGLTEKLRYILTSTYQSWEREKQYIEQLHLTNEYVIWFLKLEIYWKEKETQGKFYS